MIYYIYKTDKKEDFDINELLSLFKDLLNNQEFEAIDISMQENPFTHTQNIRLLKENRWAMFISIDRGEEVNLSNKYMANHLQVNDENKQIIIDSKSRLYVCLTPMDKEYPEDCIEALDILEEIPNSLLFAPLEHYRKKMSDFAKQITKQKVRKQIESIMINSLEKLGYENQGKLLFCKAENKIIEIVFYKPSQLEDVLCTRASFCVYKSDGKIHKEIPTKDGFITWYVEPDGSNLDEALQDLEEVLAGVDDNWFEL